MPQTMLNDIEPASRHTIGRKYWGKKDDGKGVTSMADKGAKTSMTANNPVREGISNRCSFRWNRSRDHTHVTTTTKKAANIVSQR